MKKIVCYGEVLWDMLPSGKKLGGAPLNVALRAQSFGHKASVISCIGEDASGKGILEEMRKYSADLDHIHVSKNFDTSEVVVKLDANGSATYDIKLPCAWDDIEFSQKDLDLVKTADAFIYGSLVARSKTSRDTLFTLLDVDVFRVFDVNLRAPHYLQDNLELLMKAADFIKFNDDEIFEICDEMGLENMSLESCIRYIAEKTNTSQLCVTLGKDGAVLYVDNAFVYNHGYQVRVADTVGSGDSFLATLISKLLDGASPKEAIDFACAVGAIVASKHGANPSIEENEITQMIASR